MCEPATIVMAGAAVLSAATAVYGFQQQKKATVAMAKVKQNEIDAQAQQRTADRMAEARALRSQARAAAAEAAVSGNSVDVMLDDIMGQAGRDVALIESNRKNGVASTNAEADARLRTASAEMYGGLASSAQQGAGAYAHYQQYKIENGG